MARARRTEWLVLIVLVGFVVAFVSHYVMGQYVLRGYPFSTFLYDPSDANFSPAAAGQPSVLGIHRFGDFFEPWANSRGPHPYVDFPLTAASSYFPVTHVVLFPLAQLPLPAALTIYLAGFTLAFGVLVFRHVAGDRLARTRAALVLTACSTPVLFLLDRGNIEGLLFLMLAAALLAYRRERFYLAAVILAVPIAMKGSAGVFWLLFLLDGQFRALLLSMVVCFWGTIGALAVIPGGINDNLVGLGMAVSSLTSSAGSGTAGIRHTVSLKGAFGALGHFDETFEFFVAHYALVGFLIMAGVVGALAILRPTFWQRVAVLSAAMIVVPSVSYEYRMINLYLPLLLFLGSSERRRSDALFVALFGLLLVPKGLPILYKDVSLGAVVNPLLLLVLIGMVLFDCARDPRGRERRWAIGRGLRRRTPSAEPATAVP